MFPVCVARATLCYMQCCSPRGHGLGLEAPQGLEKRSWSWSSENSFELGSAVILEDMVLVSRHLEDLKKGLGLGLDKIVLVLVLILKKGLVDSTGYMRNLSGQRYN
jgi:hypothetical protein